MLGRIACMEYATLYVRRRRPNRNHELAGPKRVTAVGTFADAGDGQDLRHCCFYRAGVFAPLSLAGSLEMRTCSSRLLQALILLSLAVCASAMAVAAADHGAEAIRLNNDGVAWMNQQQTERAEAAFAQAFAKDKTLSEAALNDGIALLYLQKLAEAQAALKQAIALAPGNPRMWYNLGLVLRAANDLPAAEQSFQRAVELDPRDADSLYFEGVCLQDQKQFV